MRLKRLGAVLLAAALVFSQGYFAPRHSNAADGPAALYLGEDRETRGAWYVRDDGAQANSLEKHRLYGRDGVLIPYHKNPGNDGQTIKNVKEDIQDLTPESKCNYVELPAYIDSFSSNIETISGDPHGYWCYGAEQPAGSWDTGHEDQAQKLACALYSADTSKWDRKDIQQDGGDIQYTVNVNDNDWHAVSVYMAHHSKDETQSQYVRILDHSGRILKSVLSVDNTRGVYQTFAFRGNIIVQGKNFPGGSFTEIAGIFFDPLLTDVSVQKTGLSAALREGSAKEVELKWTNGSAASEAVILRKLSNKDDTAYELIGYAAAGADSYMDTTASVAKTYTYMIGSRVTARYDNKEKFNDSLTEKQYSLPKGNAECSTAKYTLTSLEFEKDYYNLGDINQTVELKATLREGVTYDENDNLNPGSGKVFPNKEIVFSLDGSLVYDTSQPETKPNMKAEVGRAVTDSNGVAAAQFSPAFGGSFKIIAQFMLESDPLDEMKGFDECFASADIDIGVAEWEGKPYLMSVTDAVKPEETLIIYGNGLTPDEQKVAVAPATTGGAKEFSTGIPGLKYLDILQGDLKFAKAVTLTLPVGFEPGVYDIWVQNGKGWSNNLKLNGARPLFLDQEAAYEGLDVEIVGRNFFPDEFGLSEAKRADIRIKLEPRSAGDGITLSPKTGVRYAANTPGVYEVGKSMTGKDVYHSNPYRVTFTVPTGIMPDDYDVWVANDGINFERLYNGQFLKVVAKKPDDSGIADNFPGITHRDPLNLGVYWAQDINWAGRTRVNPSWADGTDRTSQIQGLINSRAVSGGGVIFFPNGTYLTGPLTLPGNVVLVGESQDGVILEVSLSAPSPYFVKTDSDYSGVARFTVKLKQGSYTPDFYFMFQDKTEAGNTEFYADLRQLKNVFIKEVTMNLPLTQDLDGHRRPDDSHRGASMIFNGKKNFLVADCDVHGFFAVLHRGYVSQYVSVRNSVFEAYRDVMHIMANYAFIENTALLGDHEDGHGWSARSECYFGDNYIEKVGPAYPEANNNGEVIMLEPPAGQLNYGNILAAAGSGPVTIDGVEMPANCLLLACESGVPMTTKEYSDYAVCITDGTGAGQWRYIQKAPVGSLGKDGFEEGYYGNMFQLREGERPWDILPDQTSLYTLYLPQISPTIVNNKAYHCGKSILLYSQIIDGLAANNDMKDTEGISIYSTINANAKGTNFFNRIVNNTVEGVSPMTFKGGIGINTGRFNEGRAYKGTLTGVTVIRGNTLKNMPSGDFIDQSEQPETRGIYLRTRGGTGMEESGDVSFTVVENNSVEACEYGVWMDSRVYNVLILGNEFKDLENPDIVMQGPQTVQVWAKLTFDLAGGTYDGKLDGMWSLNSPLPEPAKAGFGFRGWSYDPDGGEVFSSAPAGSGKLYAIWGEKVTVRFDSGGGSAVSNVTVWIGDKITSPQNPTLDGYTFNGWHKEESCVNAWSFDSDTVTADVTLYAKWEKNHDPPPVTPERGCKKKAAAAAGLIGIAVVALALKKRRV